VDAPTVTSLQALARTQHGLFTLAQARSAGATRTALARAVDRRWLRPVRRGVYAFGGRPPSRWESITAATLAAGPEAVISHRSAAEIHGFWGIAAATPELTIPGRGTRCLDGVVVHRGPDLVACDIVGRAHLPVTSPVRTAIDLAASCGDHLLGRLLDEGAIARLWRAEDIAERLDLPGGSVRGGTRRLRVLLAQRLGEGHPDSLLEQRVIRVLKGRVAPFVVHHRVTLRDRVVDMDVAWPDRRIDGEIDGYRVRSASRRSFDADRVRANLLAAHGWRTVHFTSTMDAATIVGQVAPLLA